MYNLYCLNTMAEKKFTNELKQTFSYIKNTILNMIVTKFPQNILLFPFWKMNIPLEIKYYLK